MQPYFSFEKEIWKSKENTTLTLCRFERFLDKPVVPRGPKGSPDEHALEGSTVIHDGEKFLMWYIGRRPPVKNPWAIANLISVGFAESIDGIHWTKPRLNQMNIPCGKAPNNVLANVSPSVYGAGVMKIGDEYVMSHFHPRGLKKEEPQTTFSMYRSKDGLHWKGSRKACIKEQHFEGASSFYWFAGKYWVAGQGVSPYYHMPDGRECGRVMVVYSSNDLKNWKRHPKPVFAYPIPRYFREAGLQNHQGASVENRGRIAIGMMGQFWPAGFTESVRSTWGLIYSYDGLGWQEPFTAEPLLMPDETSWDSGMMLQSQGLYSRGDTGYFWYGGASAAGGNGWSTTISIGICRIRRDGYAYLSSAGGNRSLLETNALTLRQADNSLYLNLQASSNDPVEVICHDARTKKLLGSARVTKSGVFVPAISLMARTPATKVVVLRFVLHGKSRLYSFYLDKVIDPVEHLSNWK
jgi:hypothetical protein